MDDLGLAAIESCQVMVDRKARTLASTLPSAATTPGLAVPKMKAIESSSPSDGFSREAESNHCQSGAFHDSWPRYCLSCGCRPGRSGPADAEGGGTPRAGRRRDLRS